MYALFRRNHQLDRPAHAPRRHLLQAGFMVLCLSLASASQAQSTPTTPTTPTAPTVLTVFAAGSLTGALGAIIEAYSAQTGQRIQPHFGPAGLLRERIEQGAAADLFASANMEHPQALAQAGLASPPTLFARNRLCATALPGFGLTSGNVIERLLDPAVALGTSTPGADPGGDYAWQLFAKLDRLQPGAYAQLAAKAQPLVGGRSPAQAPRTLKHFLQQGRIHMALGYCSARQTTADPDLTRVELPAEIAVTAQYGIALLPHGQTAAAADFVRFLLSPAAQQILARYGFMPVTQPVSQQPSD